MAEQSHRDEMNAAIRAQRERQAVPRSLAPPEDPPVAPATNPDPEPAAEVDPVSAVAADPVQEPAAQPKSWLDRLRGR